MISIIACIGKNRELGKNGDLCFHDPEDMAFFRATTLGHPVVMGRKTYDSIGKPLKGRQNFVISRSPTPEGTIWVSDIQEFIEQHRFAEEEIFVIGGASIYEMFLPYADRLYLTEMNETADADVFFPKFNPAFFRGTPLKTLSNGKIMLYKRKSSKIERPVFLL